MTTNDQCPSHNIEAEKKVLGAMIRDVGAILWARENLKPEMFYQQSYKIIFETILHVSSKNEKGFVDLTTICEKLEIDDNLKRVGGPYELTNLAQSVATSANVDYHGAIVIERYQRRSIAHQAQIILSKIQTVKDIEEITEEINKQAQFVQINTKDSGLRQIKHFIMPVIENIQDQIERSLTGTIGLKDIQTGLPQIDRFTGGMDRGEMIVLGARPSAGKTALAIQIAGYVAGNHGPVAFFTLEMPTKQIVKRELCGRAEIPVSAINRGRISKEDIQALLQKTEEFDDLPLYLDDEGSLAIERIRTRAESLHADVGKIALVVIDYLQLMGLPKLDQQATLNNKLEHISKNVKALAKHLDCPVLLLSQLTRTNVRDKRKPRLEDLRGSGGMEQDADMVWFLHTENEGR